MNLLNKLLVVILLVLGISACGGGSDGLSRDQSVNNPPTSPPASSFSINLQIENAQGQSANQLSENTPLNIIARVTDDNNNPVVDSLVTFSFDRDGIANFNNDTGTALTNSAGEAIIGLLVGNDAGDGVVTASIAQGTSNSIGFRSSGIQQQAAVPASLALFASAIQLASSGSDDIELIAVVKNDNNVLLQGVDVDFAANQGASLQIVNATTTEDGTARAILRTTNNPENRRIDVVASSDTLSATLSVDVVGTEITISATPSVIINDTVPITLLVADSNGVGIAGQQVSISSDIGQIDSPQAITGPSGQVSVNFSAGLAGVATIQASALNSSSTYEIRVQQDDFAFVQTPTQAVPLNTNANLSLRWFKNNQAFSGGNIQITSSRGQLNLANVVTDANGMASVSIQSQYAGPASISALGTDGAGNQVSARANIDFIATQVDNIFVDATPDLIGPEGQESTISAVVRDPTGNLVKGKIVNFSLIDASGGSITPNSATTDSNGIASTTYYSNAVSGQDSVTVQAESDGIIGSTDLTVGDRAFDIVIGTGGEIESPDSASYLKEFAVFVSDSVGRPVAEAELTASATPVSFTSAGGYRKGFWQWNSVDSVWESVVTANCKNEDLNQNGRLDVGEDINGDGELTPGIVATIGFQSGENETNASGQAILELRYPKQFGPWVDLNIKVFGQTSGSEASDNQTFTLSVASDDLDSRAAAPPNNPYGVGSSCNDTL